MSQSKPTNRSSADAYRDFSFKNTESSHMHRHFMPPLSELCGSMLKPGVCVLDVECGNGFTVGKFLARGCEVVGIYLSGQGIRQVRLTHPEGRFELLPVDDKILHNLKREPFYLVVSTKVVEHLYAPHLYIAGCFAALKPGERLVLSTPYHSYLKNLLLALAGHFDVLADPLWDGEHIKLWSRQKLSALLSKVGFIRLQFRGASRLPFLWMTMLMAGDRPTWEAAQT